MSVLKYFPTPLRFVEPVDDSDRRGARIEDANGNMVAQLYWPCHPPAETEAAEEETYALGRAMAEAFERIAHLEKMLEASNADYLFWKGKATQREHVESANCWCTPILEYVAENGAKVWKHRKSN